MYKIQLVDAGRRAGRLEANATPDTHMRCARRAALKRALVRGALALAGGAGAEGEGDAAALRRFKRVL